MSDKDKNYIINSLLKTYSNSSLIDEAYITNILNSISSDTEDVIFTCKKIINNYLVEQAKKDENILFELAIDMASVKERICRKLNLDEKDLKYDDYLIEGILNYDGNKDLELFLSSYLMKKIRMKYVPEKTDKKLVYKDSGKSEPTKAIETTPIVIEKEQEQLNKEEIIEVVTKESILEEQTIQEQANSKLKGTSKNTSETKKLTKKQLKRQKRKETKTEVPKQEESSFDIPIEDLDEILAVSHESQEEFEDITKDLCEPLDLDQKVREITLEQKGSGKENILIKLYKLLGVNDDDDNLLYTYYKKLRFGIYETYYTLQEITEILNITLDETIEYEEYTANIIKETLSKDLEQNISLTLK